MRRALGPFVDLIAMIGLVWLLAIAILLIGLPIVAIVRLVDAEVTYTLGTAEYPR